MAKAGNAGDFLELVRDFTAKRSGDLPFDKDNSFEISRKLSPKDFGNTQALYVIEQPVYLVTSDGDVCFLSPMYSPIPVPAESLQCRLF